MRALLYYVSDLLKRVVFDEVGVAILVPLLIGGHTLTDHLQRGRVGGREGGREGGHTLTDHQQRRITSTPTHFRPHPPTTNAAIQN